MIIVTLRRLEGAVFAAVALSLIFVSGCTERNEYEIRNTEAAFAYRSASPHAGELKKCVLVNTVAESCTLNELPLIGDGETTPGIDQIMDRVLVTHNWMGARFEEVLNDSPDSLLSLFSSTTAILIGSNVRPSFYTRLNGAIQIDPVYLWTTSDEKSSISKAEDFRSDYGKDLQFWFLTRLANPDGNPVSPYYSLDDDSVRPIEHVKLPLQRLLFHELVHATDFMPRHKIASLDTSLSIYNSIQSIREDWLSNVLVNSHPLLNDTLRGFAEVRYRGNDATAVQKSTDSAAMGELMATDGAIKFYSYTSQHEDLSQLIEAVMMGFEHDSITNVGFTQKPSNEDNYSCTDLLVDWGQRNRLADPLVNVRARAATELAINLTPALTSFMDTKLGQSESMTNRLHWCNNQKPSSFVSADIQARTADLADSQLNDPMFMEIIRHENIVHPEGMFQD